MRRFLSVLGTMLAVTQSLFVWGASSCQAGDSEPAFGKQPNIVLIITDDQGYYDLSGHGNPHIATPNLDKLREESLRFTRFQVSPTCAPTRSSIMSGRAPFYVGVTHTILERERMKLGVPTMPEMLRDAGYTTGLFGKWHLGDQDPYRPDRRGFDEVFMHGAGGIGQSYQGSCGDAPDNKYFDPAILHNNKFVKTKGFCTDIFFNQAMSWMESQDGKKPFFAYITTNAPHGPFIAPDSYKKKFEDAGFNERTVGFYGMVENIDDNVKRLTDKLDQLGIADDTLLIFMTDNGPSASNYNGDHKGKKNSVDEGGTRVPSFWRWPGVLKPGTDVDRVANHFDMLPTFAAIVGGTAKEADQLHGRSLVPLLKDAGSDWEDRFRVFHKGRWANGTAADARGKDFAVRNQKYRLVGRDQLYDMEADPSQKTNVIAEHSDVAKQMTKHYDKWYDGALPNMVNEDVKLTGHNTFHLMYWKQYKMEVPPVKVRKPRKPTRAQEPKKKTAAVSKAAAANARSFICADTGLEKAMIFDDTGRLVWDYSDVKCVDVSMLENGNILMCHESPKASWVREVDRDKKTVWEYKVKGEAQSCQRLPNGNTLVGICTSRELVEVSPDNKIVARIKVQTNAKNSHKVMRRVRKGSDDGLYYVAHHGEGVCRVYDADSNVVREIPHYPGFCYSATPLAEGRVLLTGKDLMKIVGPDDEILWQIEPDDVADAKIASFCGAHVLENGNIVVSNWLGHGMSGTGKPVVEITPEKTLAWSFGDVKQTDQVLGVQVLDQK
jgi:arylsulfatase A-like enzyme